MSNPKFVGFVKPRNVGCFYQVGNIDEGAYIISFVDIDQTSNVNEKNCEIVVKVNG